MYKCSECSMEYEIKPDYCDCGNDVFIEIKSDKPKNEIKENLYFKNNLPSIVFLGLCIILSFAILFFVGNPKDEQVKKEDVKIETKKDIPDIDKIWNDEKPKEVKRNESIKQAVIEPLPIKKQPEIKNQPVEKPKKEVQKNISLNKIQNIQKQAQITKNPQTVQKPQAVQKPQITQKTQPTQTSTAQTNPIQTKTQSAPIVVEKPKQINPEELKQYKKALRNKIASNIDFLSVAGDGKCTLSFNISQSGALLNRKFITQSQNLSLNDAVYNAMMKVPSFKTPPEGYKNETMKLNVKITGGNFEVSLE